MTDLSYTKWDSATDQSLTKLIGNFVKSHRLEQNKTQEELAQAVGISRSTLSLLERGETVTLTTLIQVLRVLNLLQILEVFEVNNKISPLLLAKMEKKEKRRARRTDKNQIIQNKTESDW